MIRLILAAAAMAAPQTAGDIRSGGNMPTLDPMPGSAFCPETAMSLARKMGEQPPDAIRLTDLPPAQMFMAVDRRVDGCPAPIVVQYGIGGR